MLMPETVVSAASNQTQNNSVVPTIPKQENANSNRKESGDIKQTENKNNPDSNTLPIAEIKKFKVRGDNEKDYEFTEEEIKAWAGRGLSSDRKNKESIRIKQQAENFLKALRENPFEVLSDPRLGIDVRKAAEQYLFGIIQQEALPKEQRELLMAQKRIRDLEDEKLQRSNSDEEQKFYQLTAEYKKQISNQIVKAIEASDLPKTRETVKRIAYYLQNDLERERNRSISDIIPLVREDYINEFKNFSGILKDEELISSLGENTLKKIREYELKKFKSEQNSRPAMISSEPAKVKESEKLTGKEWLEKLGV